MPYHKHKKHFLEIRFDDLKYRLSNIFKYKRQRQTDEQINLEKECAYLVRDIEQYGFAFFANHYQYDKIDELETKVKELQRFAVV